MAPQFLVKLVSREPGRIVLRLDSREYDALRAALALRAHLPRHRRPLTGDTAIQPNLRSAEEDLEAALGAHREELTGAVERLLADPKRCAVQPRGARVLTLNSEDTTLLLQVLNEVRIGAWEKLGCPDFETAERPKVTEDNFLCLWALQVTDLFQGLLLTALMGEE